MKFIRQGADQCGQACVAMLANISLEEAIEAVGKQGATRTRDIVDALRLLGLHCADRLSCKKAWSPVAILSFQHPNGRKHWVVWNNGKYYDPAAGVFGSVPNYLSESKVTSYLRIGVE